MPAKNVLQKYWNGTDWVELHPVTKASNVIMSDHISVQDKLDTHLADLSPHGRFNHTSDLVYTSGKLTRVDDKIGGVLRQRTTLTYTGDDLVSVNVKLYAPDGTTVTSEYTDTLTYTAGELTSAQRTVA
ncbi:hypothetical protein [Desulforamulus aquiferis]|uniref:DUF4440 domain-containing protein n=1 Tax=Desulforamulus aquiferis TaxID=1397668 RepID=A0AAW7ZDE1_9FIRM|nr:hypothetical protein [Desulforamulus aquiferis]MDO7787505.1 hypothetical protein [Desulforamulus aquiferis]